ncbi:MAG TPA: hypothetical protein DCS87_04915 [Rheinheimera sp.]|nr:hypothetical protein [Rheinheimera sp.]
MARYCGEKNPMVLLENAKQFQQRCLVDGKSLFTDLPVWTATNCDSFAHYFIDNPDEGDDDFLQKLEGQLASAAVEVKILAAEMLWLMFLCPSNTGPTSKRQSIERVISWSGLQIDPAISAQYLSDVALSGVGSAGTAYNTGRWRELNYCIRMTGALLKLSPEQRVELFNDHLLFAKWLEAIPENESRQLRHMLLFLFFPDFNERIFGKTDRRSILLNLAGIPNKQISKFSAFQIDSELLKLRKQYEKEFGTAELDYYVEPLKSQWKNAEQTVVKGVTEPSKLYQVNVIKTSTQSLNRILYGPPGTGKTYNTINTALEIVDPDYLSRHGADRSLIKARFDELVEKNRIGFVTFHQSFSYEDFVEGLKANNTENGQVTYDIEDGIFKRMCAVGSLRPELPQVKTNSHIDIAGRQVWKMSLGDTQGEDAFIYEQCIENGYVLLGYGYDIDFTTGKDRQGVIDIYKQKGVQIENESNDYRVTSVHYFKNVMSIGDLIVVSDGNRRFRAIGEVTGDYEFAPELVDDVSYRQLRKVVWHRVYQPSLPVDELFSKNLSQMTLYRLREPVLKSAKLQDLVAGNSGQTSKTSAVSIGSQVASYIVESISAELITLRKPNGSLLPMPRVIINELITLVKANKISIEDIRSKQVFERINDSALEKYIVNGYPNVLAPLVEILITYGIDTSFTGVTDKRVLIIDEINRGNISSIFGELITLIEPSKRAGGAESLAVKLPYSKERFSVPSNLYIVGTMNTADKSLAQVDIALRRRFEFVEMMPKPSLLDDIDCLDIDFPLLLKTINQRIELLYDREHTIGHSFFMPLKDDPTIERLARIFELEILPLLEEYFFEDWERVGQVLGDHLKKDKSLKFFHEKFTDEAVATLMGNDWGANGVRPYIRNRPALLNPKAYKGIYDALESE